MPWLSGKAALPGSISKLTPAGHSATQYVDFSAVKSTHDITADRELAMIIQCEQCRTKFKLDDEKVSDRGVKVRCAKCRHVFTVRKDVAQAGAVDAMLPETVAAAPFPVSDETVRMAAAPASEPEVAGFSAEPEVAFDFGAAPVEAAVPDAVPFSFEQPEAAAGSSFDFGDVAFTTEPPVAPAAADFGEMTMVMPPKQQAAEAIPEFSLEFGSAAVAAPATPAADEAAFDFGDALASSSISDATAQKVEFDFGDQASSAVAQTGDIDLAGFDFGTAPAAAVTIPTGIDTTDFSDFSAATAPQSAVAGGFSFDDAVPQPATAATDSFDFSGVDLGMGQPQTTVPASEVDTFSLGEVDFSSDTAAVAVDASATAPAGTLFAPVEESVVRQQEIAKPDISFDLPGATDEQPPSITSRRRQSSTLSILIAVITVVVLAVLGYMAYSFISDGPKAVSLFGNKAGVPVEDGKITVQNIKAYFIPKAAAGELLVITGEALNNFKKPRAALQVKGMVFGAANQAVATKTAYAGNLLTKEQLAEMPAEKIEAAMNNQFGDSLANLEVQPGKTIPFTIVIINPPVDGKEFGVEPVGSTVAAAGK